MKKIEEGPLQDRRKAQAKKRQTMDLLRRKQVQDRMAVSRSSKEKEKQDIIARRGLRAAQASKYAQKNWRQEEAEVEEEHDCNETHPGMTHKEWAEDQKIEALYVETSGAKGSKKKELFKARKFRNVTPGQVRDFEKLSATRMFQAYEQKADEDAPTTTTAGVANWDPLLGGKTTTIYTRKRRKIDARSKDYRETIQRVQARRDKESARELEQKLNMFGVQSNPFKEEIEMENNNKYLKTKVGSIEEAVLKSLATKKPVNPNDARPTLHLPEKKYLQIKEGSLASAVTNIVTEKFVPGETTDTHTSVGSKQKIKPSYNTKTHKLITLPNGSVKVVKKDVPGMEAEEKDKPEQGKVYALTGRSDQPSIARGDSWKKSVVTKKRKEQDAKKND